MFFKRIVINLKRNFIRIFKDKKLAQRYKHIQYAKLFALQYKSTKWGVSYSVFDGLELLEHSIESIRNSCNYINVVYSDISWYGNKTNEDILSILKDLQERNLIDEIIYYKPDLALLAVENERNKRNLGLRFAKKAKIDYFMTMDADEFYLQNEVEIAKRYILKNNITHSFCNIVNYSILPTHRFLRTPSFVQFFSKLKRNSILETNKKIITIIDPTRQLNHYWGGAKYFFLPQVEMHHMTIIRKNLLVKFKNSTARDAYKIITESFYEYKKRALENTMKSQDLFNLTDLATKFLEDAGSVK